MRRMIARAMQTREDDKFVYYEIPLNGAAMENFDVRVEHGQVMIENSKSKIVLKFPKPSA